MRLIHCLCLTLALFFFFFLASVPWRHGDRLADVGKRRRKGSKAHGQLSVCPQRTSGVAGAGQCHSYTLIPDRGSGRYCWVFSSCMIGFLLSLSGFLSVSFHHPSKQRALLIAGPWANSQNMTRAGGDSASDALVLVGLGSPMSFSCVLTKQYCTIILYPRNPCLAIHPEHGGHGFLTRSSYSCSVYGSVLVHVVPDRIRSYVPYSRASRLRTLESSAGGSETELPERPS
ncbi:hypothetical protein V8C34DRAFT_256012 [Trichoderma compactum]